MGRSILAVVLGYLVMAIAVVGTDLALGALSPAPPGAPPPVPGMPYLLFTLVTGFVYAVAGGYLAAWLARRQEVKHALALAGLVVIMGLLSMIQYWGKQPLWYQIALIVVGVLGVLLGGRLRARQWAKAPAAGSGV
jgi:hypothetical protein